MLRTKYFALIVLFLLSSCGLQTLRVGKLQGSFLGGKFKLNSPIPALPEYIYQWTFNFKNGLGQFVNGCKIGFLDSNELITTYTEGPTECSLYPASGTGSDPLIDMGGQPKPVEMVYCVTIKNKQTGQTVFETQCSSLNSNGSNCNALWDNSSVKWDQCEWKP